MARARKQPIDAGRRRFMAGAAGFTFAIAAGPELLALAAGEARIIGSAGMGISLAGLGAAAYLGTTAGWVLLFVLGYIACFAMSVGPVVWVVMSEIFPTKVRGRATGIATLLLWAANYLVSQTFPMIDEDPILVGLFNHAFPFWLYAAFCGVMIWVVYRFVPETKGKSLDAIEHLWLGR